jgi:hypothetical protein
MRIDAPDGTRVELQRCTSCKRDVVSTDDRMIVLCRHPYCNECFPKMVAVLEADARQEFLQLTGSWLSAYHAARARMEGSS